MATTYSTHLFYRESGEIAAKADTTAYLADGQLGFYEIIVKPKLGRVAIEIVQSIGGEVLDVNKLEHSRVSVPMRVAGAFDTFEPHNPNVYDLIASPSNEERPPIEIETQAANIAGRVMSIAVQYAELPMGANN